MLPAPDLSYAVQMLQQMSHGLLSKCQELKLPQTAESDRAARLRELSLRWSFFDQAVTHSTSPKTLQAARNSAPVEADALIDDILRDLLGCRVVAQLLPSHTNGSATFDTLHPISILLRVCTSGQLSKFSDQVAASERAVHHSLEPRTAEPDFSLPVFSLWSASLQLWSAAVVSACTAGTQCWRLQPAAALR